MLIKHYQRIINIFKFIFIIGITIILLLLYSWVNLPQVTIENNAKFTKANTATLPSQNYEITMFNSIFEGISNNEQPYKIISDTAIKIAEDQYELKQIAAQYKFFDNDILINAQHALIDNDSKLITLTDNVKILLNDLQCHTAEMLVNLIDHKATSNEKVVVYYNNSRISADNLVADGTLNTMKLQGHVQARIDISDF
jgi:LPS export ABC transporter protein LptC